jgi:hypothetical protein
MKVLKKGRSQKGWSTKAKCTGSGNGDGGCGAELLVEEDDLFRTESHARDETTTYVTFTCADCGILTDLDKHSVPDHVLEYLPTRDTWKTKQRSPTGQT